MPSLKISEAANLVRGRDRRCNNALETAAHLGFKGCRHGMSCLADGNHQYARVRIEIVQVFANAQHSTFATHVKGERAFDRGVLERGGEDFARNITHLPEL